MPEAPSTQRPDPWRWLAQRKSSALPAKVPEPPEKVDLKKSLVPAHQRVLPPPPGESGSVQTSVLPKPPKNFVLDGRKILGVSGDSVVLDDGKLVSRNQQYIENLRRAGYTEITADQVKSLSKQGRAPYPIAGPYYPPEPGSEAEKTGQTVLSRVAEFASTPLVPLKKAAERILSTAEAEPPRDVYVRGRLIKQAKPGLTAFERGFIKGTAGFLEGLTTPVNVALLATIPLTAGVPVLGGLISAGFSADMIFGKGGLIDKSPEFVRQVKSGDVEGAVELGVEMAGTAAFATGAGKHAASRWKSDFQRSLAKKTARAKADELVKQFEKAPPMAYEMTVADLLAERQPKPPVPEVKPTGEKRTLPESPPILSGKPKTPEDLRMIQGKPGSPDDLRMIEGKAKRPEELELERLEERAKRVRDELERERERKPTVVDRRRAFEGPEAQDIAVKQIAQPAPTGMQQPAPPAVPETPVVEKTIRPRMGLSIQAARARQYDEGTIERFIVENGGMRPSKDMVEGAKGKMPEEFRYMLRQRPGAKSDASAADYLDPVYNPKSPYTPDQMVQSMKSEGLVPESFTENDLFQILSGRKVGTRGTNFPGHERQEKIDALEREFEQMTEQDWDALTEKQRTRVIDEIEKLESEIPDEVETKNFGELINFLEEVGTKHERTIAGQLEKPAPEGPKPEGSAGGDAPGPAAERVPAGPSRGPIATEQLATETEAFLKENARQQAAQEADLLSLEMKQKSRQSIAGELPIEESPLFGGPRQKTLEERPPEIYSEKLHQAIILADENRFYDALSYFRPEDRARVDERILEAGAGPEAIRQVIREEARALIELPPPPSEGPTPSATATPSARGNQVKVEILEKTKIPTLRELRPGEAGFLRINLGDRGKSQKAEDIARRAEEEAAKKEAGFRVEDRREYLERELPPPPGERTQIPDVPPPPSGRDPLADVRDPLTRAIARDYTEGKGLFAESETKLPSGSSVSHPGPGKATTKPPKDLNVIKANVLSAHSILRGHPYTQPVYDTIITAENAKNRDMIRFFNLIYGDILKGFKPKSDEAISLVNVVEGKVMPELIKGDRNKVLDAARRLRTEVYDPLFERAKASVPEVLNERYIELLRKKSTLQKSMRPDLPDRELLKIKEKVRLIELELERTPRTRPIRYIKHYFTHIAQRQFGGMLPADVREFASDRFISRFLKAREEDAPYDLDIFEVMRVYIPSVLKSIHDVPAVERARKMVEEIPLEKKGDQVVADYFQNLRSYSHEYLNNFLGKTDIQRSEIAQAEVKLARAVASYYYRLLLGWNPFSAAINLTQTGLNTFPVLGTRYTLEGIRRLSTPNGRKEVAESGLFLDYPLLAEEASKATGKVRDLLGPMKMFNTAEFWNRGVAYLGGKAKGRSLGLKGIELENYALDVVDRTQFRYTRADAIRGLQQSGPLGAAAPVIGQFKTYPMKQAEFIWNEIIGNLRSEPARALRFMVVATVLGMPVLEFLPYDMVAPFERDINFLLQVVQGKKKITAEELAKRVPGLRQLITIPQKIDMER